MKGISNKDYKELMDKILTAQPVYIKDLGTEVLVTKYSWAKGYRYADHICSINFTELPNKLAVSRCEDYNIKLEENSYPNSNRNVPHHNGYDVYVSAHIHISKLRAVPFKGGASKVLYGSKKT